MCGLFSLNVHIINSVVLTEISASCKLEGTLLCFVHKRVGEMLLKCGFGAKILEAKGSLKWLRNISISEKKKSQVLA